MLAPERNFMVLFSDEYKPSQFNRILDILMKALRFKDPYTFAHSHRVERYAEYLAVAMGLENSDAYSANVLGLLHDIGKLFVPDEVLGKPAALNEDEWAVMRRHSEDAVRILDCMSVSERYRRAVRAMHERFDGSGYPDGLMGESIPLLARIITVADSFDAMMTDRPYRKGMPVEICRRELELGRGTQFCPQVVDTMLHLIERPSFQVYA